MPHSQTHIQLPTHNHISQILALNSKYLLTHLTDEQRQKGFIRIEYSEDDIKRIIDSKEMVIALNGNIIIGYYLIGRTCQNEGLNYQKNKTINLSDTHDIPFNKVGYGCQVCIDERFRNNGFFGEMLNMLNEAVKNKYSHLLCSISETNTASQKTHINNGWQLIDTDGTTQFFIYQILR